MLTGCWQDPANSQSTLHMTHTNCCICWIDPPEDEQQQTCSKHVEAYCWNKLIENSESCQFMLYLYTYLIYTYAVFTSKHLSKSTTSLLFAETERALKNSNEPPLFAILSHINSVHTVLYYFCRALVVLYFYTSLSLSNGLFRSDFLTETLYAFSYFVYACCFHRSSFPSWSDRPKAIRQV